MKLLGLIGAMACEIDALRARMEDAQETSVADMHFFRGRLYGREAVLALSGIGKVHAAMCTQAMICLFHPDLVLNLGVAGALDERLHIGDIVIAESAVQHDVDTTALGDPAGMISGPNIVYIPCDAKAKEALLRAAQKQGLHFLTAVIATGDRFMEAQDEKHALRGAFGAAACDMEGGAIAQVCYENKTPYAAYRAVSDTLSGNGQEYAVNAAAAADRGARLLRAFMEAL